MDFFNSSDFDTFVRRLAKEFHVPGLAVSFIQNDNASSKVYGITSMDSGEWCSTDTQFNIGDYSESFIATAVGLLVEDDENYPDIQWDTPISKLLPEDFVMIGDEYTQGVTVEDILSHRTGLPCHKRSRLSQDTPITLTRNLRNLPITAPLRSKYQYCDMMYIVASHLVEVHTKTSFSNFLRRRLFEPLGMHSTNYYPSGAKIADLGSSLACPHFYDSDGYVSSASDHPTNSELQGNGSFYSTINDMLVYIRAIINETLPFTSSFLKALMKPRITVHGPCETLDFLSHFHEYALGWEISFYRGHLVLQCDSLAGGFSSTVFFLPSLKIGGTVLTNSDSTLQTCRSIAGTLIDACLPELSVSDKIDWVLRARDAEGRKESSEMAFSEKQRQDLLCDKVQPEPHTTPLEIYVGEYHNIGYHTLKVEIQHGALLIDISDRSEEVTLDFRHIRGQKWFEVTVSVCGTDLYYTKKLVGEFIFDKERRCIAMKLGLEPEMEDLIRFDKVDAK